MTSSGRIGTSRVSRSGACSRIASPSSPYSSGSTSPTTAASPSARSTASANRACAVFPIRTATLIRTDGANRGSQVMSSLGLAGELRALAIEQQHRVRELHVGVVGREAQRALGHRERRGDALRFRDLARPPRRPPPPPRPPPAPRRARSPRRACAGPRSGSAIPRISIAVPSCVADEARCHDELERGPRLEVDRCRRGQSAAGPRARARAPA